MLYHLHRPTPYNIQLHHGKMLTLRELIKLESLKLSYRLHHNLLPENLHRLLWTDSKDNSSKRLISTTLDIDYYQHYLKHKVSHITKISNFNVLKHMKEFLWKSGNQGPWKLLYGELRKPSMTMIVSLLTLQCPWTM